MVSGNMIWFGPAEACNALAVEVVKARQEPLTAS